MAKKLKTQLEIINEMVKKSFGKRFAGNCIPFSDLSGNHIVNSCKLESIAKRKWPYIPGLIENCEVAGRFTSQDGSEINVSVEYLNNAKRYDALYKKHFNKEVLIQIR